MRFIAKILFFILLVLLTIASIFIFGGKRLYESKISKISLENTIKEIRDGENYVKLKDLPDDYLNAVIAVEDHRFKEHGAVDYIAVCRAIFTNIRNSEVSEGGSTITQQVAKNIFFIEDNDKITRKIAEVFAAIDLEKNYSKDEILEIYVNTIYFGDGYYGIKEACKGYLDKKPSKMTLYDCTMMAGIPNAPSVYAPTKNPELTKSRQKKVISDMVKYGYLSQEQANKILDE